MRAFANAELTMIKYSNNKPDMEPKNKPTSNNN